MAYTDREDLNYLGMLYRVDAGQTPLLSALGGINGGGAKITRSFQFPVAQPWTPGAAAQPAITEAASVSSNTATTVTRAQDLNTVQIFQNTVEVSHAKQSTFGEISGLSALGEQPVTDEFEFQKMAQLAKMAKDLDYTMMQGAYQAASDASTAAKSRGLKNAISTNTVAAGSADLSKDMIDELVRTMVGNGAIANNMMIFANGYNKQRLSDIYGYQPADRVIGGVNIQTVFTDFFSAGVIYSPNCPTDEVYVVDMSVLSLVACPYNGQIITFEDLAQIAASKKGQWYAQLGLDYGPEEYHGSITGLATS